LTDTDLLYRDFWEGFRSYCEAFGTTLPLPLQKAPRQHWFWIRIGKKDIQLQLTASVQKKHVRCELHFLGENAKSYLDRLSLQRESVENDLGKLEWNQPAPGKHECNIALVHHGVNVRDERTWPEAYQWLKQKAEQFHATFSPIVSEL